MVSHLVALKSSARYVASRRRHSHRPHVGHAVELIAFVAFAASRRVAFVAHAGHRVIACCITTSLILIGLVTYLYLRPDGMVWMAVTCMVMYIGIASALTCISWSFVAEIFPAKVRGFGSGLSSAISFVLLFISVKVTPEIMNRFGEQVMYAGFAGVTLCTGLLLSFILPETNGRSLQDIEDSLYQKKGEKKNDIRMAALPNST